MAETAPTREPTAAEIEANVAKANAEADSFTAAAEKSRAEARKETALAEDAELKLVVARHDADRAAEKRKRELSADEFAHVYNFKGAGIDGASCEKCFDQLKVWWRNEEPGNIEIVFFSPGGGVIAGMALFDEIVAMRADGWKFTTTCRGYSASMGGILLQAGDIRVCGPESYILIHEISSGAVGKIGELEDEVEFVKLIQKRVNDIFVERSGGKVTSARLRSMYRRKDFWLDSKKALELGIVDKIG